MTKSATLNGVVAVLAAAALILAIAPVFAFADASDNGHTNVTNVNEGVVTNMLWASASTGGNGANGGNGGTAGNGGSVNGGDDNAMAGNGGKGGNGGMGGIVGTGDAMASVVVANELNSNETEIDRCACNDSEEGSDDNDVLGNDNVTNVNFGAVVNMGGAKAKTGKNWVDGGTAGNGGTAGSVNGGDDDATAGEGGAGGNGGAGGDVQTGAATTVVGAVNLVNWNWTRIVR